MGTLRLTIQRDSDPESPRQWDNLGTLVHWHPRIDLGDERIEPSEPPADAVVSLPVYCYEHGGVTISTGAFTCLFDSGQVGWIYATRESIRKAFGDASVSSGQIEAILRGEIEAFDQYLTGNVWGFVLESVSECECCGTEQTEHVDSCWGFFGDDKDGIGDHLTDDARALLDDAWDNRV